MTDEAIQTERLSYRVERLEETMEKVEKAVTGIDASLRQLALLECERERDREVQLTMQTRLEKHGQALDENIPIIHTQRSMTRIHTGLWIALIGAIFGGAVKVWFGGS